MIWAVSSKSARLRAWWPYLSLLLWVGPLLLLRSSQQSLMAHDEGIYATQARSIVLLNDWVAPQWGGVVNFDRTIGIQWLMALCYQLFGISEDSARLPSAIAFALSVLLTYAIGSRLLNPRLAWLGAAILAVTPISLQYGRLATQDAVLVFLELLGIYSLLQAEQGPNRPYWSILAGLMLGFGFMVKGFMIFPVAVALLPYLMGLQRQHRHLTNPWLYLGLILGLIPVGAWLGASLVRFGTIPFVQLFGKLFHLKGQTYQGAGPLYYFWNIPANAFPWIFFTLLGLGLVWKQATWRQQLGQRGLLLLVGYPLVLFGELTLFGTRTRYYPLQLLPFAALLAAIALDWLVQQYGQQKQTRLLRTLTYLGGGLGLLLVGLQLAIVLDLLPLQLKGISPKELQRYGMVALGLGLGWFSLLPIWWNRPEETQSSDGMLQRSAQAWLASWLIGPWFAIALLGLTGQWGDYNHDLKTFLQAPEVNHVLSSHTVNFVVEEDALNREGRKTYLLLNFYTPFWGKKWPQPGGLQPGEYAWIDPLKAAQVEPSWPVIGTIRGWKLVQR